MSVKVRVKQAVKNKDIYSMFNEICGEGVVPPHISYKKYSELKQQSHNLLTLLENFSKGSFAKKYKEYEKSMAEIYVFCENSRAELAKMMPEPPFTEIQTVIPGHIKPDLIIAFSKTYKDAKEMKFVRACMTTCSKLSAYRAEIIGKKSTYIREAPGASFVPFAFTSFNIKEAFIRADMDEQFRCSLLTLTALIFEYTHAIYEIYTSPDWDPDVFVHVMRENIQTIKKQIPRCDKAFNKIEQSLDLLKDNMNSYYKDFISTQNPSIMMENFVNDVALKNTNTDLETSRQFKTIIKKYRELSGNIKDSRMETLFKQVETINKDIEEPETKITEEKKTMAAAPDMSANDDDVLNELKEEFDDSTLADGKN